MSPSMRPNSGHMTKPRIVGWNRNASTTPIAAPTTSAPIWAYGSQG